MPVEHGAGKPPWEGSTQAEPLELIPKEEGELEKWVKSGVS